ncbi:hypothetical protein HNY73_004753 [Argiope bruennichi]|uniref:DUF19 domain-containing protein n=1 Tax=Argiope bruennichi TaxID=94029 RepID=A0A8T0FQY9_ARGBR|nr:hypothetical protein HNY73_004753 [Argiope bruennichi]
MLAKAYPFIFCVFTLLVIIQGLSIDHATFEKYYKCYNYATCETDGPDHQRQHNCIFQNATLQDLQDIFEYVEDNGYFEYKSETEPKAVKEYCTYEGHKKKKAFCQTLKGILAFKNSICGMSNKQEQCTRVSNALGCLFPILDDYHSQGKC